MLSTSCCKEGKSLNAIDDQKASAATTVKKKKKKKKNKRTEKADGNDERINQAVSGLDVSDLYNNDFIQDSEPGAIGLQNLQRHLWHMAYLRFVMVCR